MQSLLWAKIECMDTPPVCDYEGSDYQHEFWETGNRAYEDAAEALALKHLLPVNGKRLLELGAGAGRNTHRYAGFEHITLLDYSTTQLQQAIERHGTGVRFSYIAADVYRLPFAPNSFDAATMIRTLHHLAEPHIALEQVRACLGNGADFILEFANKRNFKSILRYLLRKQDWNPFSRQAVEFVELNFDFHPAAVKAMLRDAGFNVQRQVSVSYLRSGLVKRLLPLKVMTALEAVLQRVFSWNALSPSIFLKAAATGQVQPIRDQLDFRCPACGHFPLHDTPPLIICDACGRQYPFKDGMYDFRIETQS